MVWGLWLLLHYWYCTLTGHALENPAIALCHGSADLDLQDQHLYVLQQFIARVNTGEGQLIALVFGLDGSSIGSPLTLPYPHYQGELSNTDPLTHPMQQAVKGRAGPSAITASEPAHLHPYHQGQLYCNAQAKYRAHSPEWCSWEGARPALLLSCPSCWKPAFSLVTSGEGWGGGRTSFPHPCHHMADDEGLGPALLLSHFQGSSLIYALSIRVSSNVLPRQSAGLTLQSAASSEGQYQFSHSHDLKASSTTCNQWWGTGRG